MTPITLTDAERTMLIDLLTREPPSALAMGILARMTTAEHLRRMADKIEETAQ